MAKITGYYNAKDFEDDADFNVWEKENEADIWTFEGYTLTSQENNVTELPNPSKFELAGSDLQANLVNGIPVISGGTITDMRSFRNERLDGSGSWVQEFSLSNAQIDAVDFYNAFNNVDPTDNVILWKGMLSGNDTFILSDNPDGNYVRSYAGNDHITGSTGNDIIDGGGGNDTIIGGGGTDIAVFSGIFRDYNITKLTGNSFTVQDTRGIDGTDLLQGISTFRFSDVDKSVNDLSTAINAPITTPNTVNSPVQDFLTGIKVLDSSTGTTKVAGEDGIIDRFVLQTNSAPSTPFKITAFNPTEDILQIPQELASGIAQRTFFGVAKVIIPDRTLTKSEQKTFKKEQKAVNKQVKSIGRTGDGFAYNQMTGQLFIDTNGRKEGFGEGGGLLAVLEDTPAIGIDNFQFL